MPPKIPPFDVDREMADLEADLNQWRRENELIECKCAAELKAVELELAQTRKKVKELQARKEEIQQEQRRQKTIHEAREEAILHQQIYLCTLDTAIRKTFPKGYDPGIEST